MKAFNILGVVLSAVNIAIFCVTGNYVNLFLGIFVIFVELLHNYSEQKLKKYKEEDSKDE